MRQAPSEAETERGVSCGTKGGTMSVDILKRKLRNFPVANLSERIAAAS
jgi:hypothetical protein